MINVFSFENKRLLFFSIHQPAALQISSKISWRNFLIDSADFDLKTPLISCLQRWLSHPPRVSSLSSISTYFYSEWETVYSWINKLNFNPSAPMLSIKNRWRRNAPDPLNQTMSFIRIQEMYLLHHLPSGTASSWISVCLSPDTHPKISENLAFLPMTGLSYYLNYIDFLFLFIEFVFFQKYRFFFFSFSFYCSYFWNVSHPQPSWIKQPLSPVACTHTHIERDT